MRKLHLISLAVLATPLVLMHACGGDDDQPPAPAGTAGSAGSGGSGGTGGKGGSGGSGTAGKGGSATGGGGSGTAGNAGSGTAGNGGGKADGGPDGSGGTGGSAAEGGTDAPKSDAPTSDAPTSDAPASDAPTSDAPVSDAPTADASNTCSADSGTGAGKNCSEYCDLFMANCNSDPVFDAGTVYANPGDCRSKCNAYSQAQLCCYIVHVNNAVGYDAGTSDRSNHCTHAAGNPGQQVCPLRQ